MHPVFSRRFFCLCQPRLDVLETHPRSEKGLNGGMTYLSGNFSLPHLERLIHDAHHLIEPSPSRGGVRFGRNERNPFTSQCVQVPQERVRRSPRQNAEDGLVPAGISVAGVETNAE